MEMHQRLNHHLTKQLKIGLLVVALWSVLLVDAQTLMLHENINDYDFKRPAYGANMKNYTHWFLGYSLVGEQTDGIGADVVYGSSSEQVVGWRYKYRLGDFFAVGTDLMYSHVVFDIDQNAQKVFPSTDFHKREKIKLNKLGTDLYFRLNFGRRGNTIGKFVDFAAFANWNYDRKYIVTDDLDGTAADNYAIENRFVYKKINYIEEFEYGLKFRMGINRWVITAEYRASDLFTSDFKRDVLDVELPRLFVGFQLGLH